MKLVVESGVGIIVVGVVKVKVDLIVILGVEGGIGVLFVLSMWYVGILFEIGLSEM